MREKRTQQDPIRKPRAKENLKWDLKCQMPLSSNSKVPSIGCTLSLEPPDGAQVQLLKTHQGFGGVGNTEPPSLGLWDPAPPGLSLPPALGCPACVFLCPLIFASFGLLLLFPAYRLPHSQKQRKITLSLHSISCKTEPFSLIPTHFPYADSRPRTEILLCGLLPSGTLRKPLPTYAQDGRLGTKLVWAINQL